MEDDKTVERKIRRRQFLSFAAFAGLGLGVVGTWRWFRGLPEDENGLPGFTRRVLDFDEKLNDGIFSQSHLAKTFPTTMASAKPRVNGRYGVEDEDFDTASWKLRVEKQPGAEPFEVSIDEIKALPKTDICFQFKCIEGWDEIVHYGGVRFADFLRHFNLGQKDGRDWHNYIALETPDGGYYVGLDMKSAMHPQSILCYELNGRPLPVEHGAPLRLVIPVKYGVKNLKRIGLMYFSDDKPRDYWHERGYVYDAAL